MEPDADLLRIGRAVAIEKSRHHSLLISICHGVHLLVISKGQVPHQKALVCAASCASRISILNFAKSYVVRGVKSFGKIRGSSRCRKGGWLATQVSGCKSKLGAAELSLRSARSTVFIHRRRIQYRFGGSSLFACVSNLQAKMQNAYVPDLRRKSFAEPCSLGNILTRCTSVGIVRFHSARGVTEIKHGENTFSWMNL